LGSKNPRNTYDDVAEHDNELLNDDYARNPTVEKDERFGKQVSRKKVQKRKLGKI